VSHTTSGDLGTTFIHNGDFSGNVSVRRPGQPEAEVPFADLRQLVLGYFRDKMIGELEDASDDTLEAMLTRGTGVAW